MKKLKTNLRRIQRQKLFSNGINQSIKLEDHLDKDKEKFWQTIKNHRQISRPSATSSNEKVDFNQFTEYYSNLFSHHDRPSNNEQIEIERKVKEKFDSINQKAPNQDCFTQNQVSKIFKEIKTGKASGADKIDNEMLKYAICAELITILTHIFNQMYKYGYTPENFNVSLVTPIPKKGECNSAIIKQKHHST